MDTQAVHIAIDVESLGLRPNSVVVSIGLVAFTIAAGTIATLYLVPNRQEQVSAGRVVCDATVAWWAQQEVAPCSVFKDPEVSVYSALESIKNFVDLLQVSHAGIDGVWGYGADFDNAMVQDLFATFGVEPAWNYKLNRCGRTATRIAGVSSEKSKIPHHALYDALAQANTIRQALVRLQPQVKR